MDPSIAKDFVRGKVYQVQFIRKPHHLYEAGSYEVMDYDSGGVLFRYNLVSEPIRLIFVPWSNIVSIDLTPKP